MDKNDHWRLSNMFGEVGLSRSMNMESRPQLTKAVRLSVFLYLLVGGLVAIFYMFPLILGMSSSQLPLKFFQRGFSLAHEPVCFVLFSWKDPQKTSLISWECSLPMDDLKN